jgi:hypothetical protein
MLDPLAVELARILNFNGQPITFDVPKDAVVVYGTGRNPLDGMTIAGWVR